MRRWKGELVLLRYLFHGRRQQNLRISGEGSVGGQPTSLIGRKTQSPLDKASFFIQIYQSDFLEIRRTFVKKKYNGQYV